LIGSVYASLVEYLATCELIRSGPFDASICKKAALNDISEEKIKWFVKHARKVRNFALSVSADTVDVLTAVPAGSSFALPQPNKTSETDKTMTQNPVTFFTGITPP